MTPYVSDELKAQKSKDELSYELKSIVVHRGGAHGGHYFAYIKDDLNEGSWYLDKLSKEEMESDPTEVLKKKFDPKEHMTEDQKKKLEEEENGDNQGGKNKNKKKNKK